jgi:hypothetical protein
MSRRHLVIALAALLLARIAGAQEMEPRAYSASPVGLNFFGVALSSLTGAVLFDPSIPITNVRADIKSAAAGVGHTFGFAGKLALLTAALPVVTADVTGQVFDEAREAKRNGLADLRLRLSVNLIGNDAMRMPEFSRRRRQMVFGTSLTVVAPSGQYFKDKLINLGNNRWGFKPELGASCPVGKWDLDGYIGTWFYFDNPEFFPGSSSRSQRPLLTMQAHATYTFRPRLWVGIDVNRYWGAASIVDDNAPTIELNNLRVGLTASVPVGQNDSIKMAFATTPLAAGGAAFDTLSIAYQTSWFSKP